MRRNSDQKPLLVSTNSSSRTGFKPFRFQNMCISHQKFLSDVAANWSLPSRHSGLKNLWDKLHRLKQYLTWLNKHIFGNIFDNLRAKESELAILEENYHRVGSDNNLRLFNSKASELQALLDMEEVHWKQKSCCSWSINGDRNTKLFHNWAQRKRRKAKNFCIEDEGSLPMEDNLIATYAVKYFEKNLSAHISLSGSLNLDQFDNQVSPLMNEKLCRLPDESELKDVIFSMNKEASAGPDGFTAAFYIATWNFVKGDLQDAVLDFSQGTSIPKRFSHTSIALIPKVKEAISWGPIQDLLACATSFTK